MQQQTMGLFPTPIAKTTLWSKSWQAQLEAIELEYVYGHWYSRDHQVLDSFPQIRDQIEHEINVFAQETLGLREQLFITQSWINVYKQGDDIHQHNHANSLVSGTWYWKTPQTTINFHKHGLNQATTYTLKVDSHGNEHRPYAIEKNTIVLDETDLLLWPSYLQHSVDPQTQEEPRCTLSFNSMPKTWGSSLYRVP